ncbi:MAG: glycoside hydrolase family 57 protein, partial [Rikenellaceae bacterium]
ANEILLEQLEKFKGKFKITFSISGLAIEQLRAFAPEVLASFKKLAKTGYVEFLAETYSHSLASLKDEAEFAEQVKRHEKLIESEFGVKPKVFKNTELIYSNGIGQMVNELGYKTIITEGAKHILGWKSPNYIYADAAEPKVKLLLRNSGLCDDIRYRFNDITWNEWPLTAEKYVAWIKSGEGDVSNIFLDYETFGMHHLCNTGIFDFLAYLPKIAIENGLEFKFPSEAVKLYQPISVLNVVHPISWADEERDTTSWLGNELQREAFNQLYSVRDKVKKINDKDINYVWDFLQSSNHFYYMSTKWFVEGSTANVNPYDSPYEAFINYMNVVSDYIRQVNGKYNHLTKK